MTADIGKTRHHHHDSLDVYLFIVFVERYHNGFTHATAISKLIYCLLSLQVTHNTQHNTFRDADNTTSISLVLSRVRDLEMLLLNNASLDAVSSTNTLGIYTSCRDVIIHTIAGLITIFLIAVAFSTIPMHIVVSGKHSKCTLLKYTSYVVMYREITPNTTSHV